MLAALRCFLQSVWLEAGCVLGAGKQRETPDPGSVCPCLSIVNSSLPPNSSNAAKP